MYSRALYFLRQLIFRFRLTKNTKYQNRYFPALGDTPQYREGKLFLNERSKEEKELCLSIDCILDVIEKSIVKNQLKIVKGQIKSTI